MFWILAVIFLIFASVIIRGAPYLNSHKRAVEIGLDLLELSRGQTVIDLGSGSGNVLLAAAKRGIRGIGYELNPILVIYSRIKLRRFQHMCTVKWGDYWLKNLESCDGLYIFLMGRFMKKLPDYIEKNVKKDVRVVCYGFEIPKLKSLKNEYGFFVYQFSPVAKQPTKP